MVASVIYYWRGGQGIFPDTLLFPSLPQAIAKYFIQCNLDYQDPFIHRLIQACWIIETVCITEVLTYLYYSMIMVSSTLISTLVNQFLWSSSLLSS